MNRTEAYVSHGALSLSSDPSCSSARITHTILRIGDHGHLHCEQGRLLHTSLCIHSSTPLLWGPFTLRCKLRAHLRELTGISIEGSFTFVTSPMREI